MKEILFSTTTEIASAIRAKEVSASEVLEAHLAHIASHNPELNAVVTLDADGARQRAQEADAAWARGELWGPLHGVPVTLKDALAVAGMRTTCGFEPLANYIPAKDGTTAARLKSAGAIIMGKTNVPVLLGDWQTDNPIFGRSNNPWDPACTPGGSSGGACAAVAAGLTPLEIGTDLSGSVRIPAAFCGVYGLKPTEHRVSLDGIVAGPPDSPRPVRIMSVIGPIARDIADLGLALRIIAGPDGRDTDVPPLGLMPEEAPAFQELRIAWTPAFPGVPVSHEIRQAVEKLAAELDRLESRVEERLPELDFGQQSALFAKLVSDVIGVFQPQAEGARPLPLADYLVELDQRDRFILAWEAFFENWDALLCPAAMTTAFEHRPVGTPIEIDGAQAQYWNLPGCCLPFNLTGHPALVMPVGQDHNGMPIGVQLVGKRWNEERLLAIARTLSQVTEGYRRPPGY
ncbi:MAG: amidase [Anaerolineaceae bacterium]|nr:amidase [Anaerolineaceae bacterium]